jgi:hypothetical protein
LNTTNTAHQLHAIRFGSASSSMLALTVGRVMVGNHLGILTDVEAGGAMCTPQPYASDLVRMDIA